MASQENQENPLNTSQVEPKTPATSLEKEEIVTKQEPETPATSLKKEEIVPKQEPKTPATSLEKLEIVPKQEPETPATSLKKEEIAPKQEPETPATSLKKEEIVPKQEPESKNENLSTETIHDDDVDLSAVEIASNLLDQTFALDDPEFDVPDSNNEAYKSIMSLCSSTTGSIKKSIYEILNSRDKSDGSEEDTTTELQESLNKKMEDFKKVISGCLDTDAPASCLENVEDKTVPSGVVIEEVMESSEDQQQADSGKPFDSDEVVKDVGSLNSKDKEDSKSKDAGVKSKNSKASKDKAKKVEINNLNTDTVGTKLDNTTGKVNAKNSKTTDKKSDTLNLSSIVSTEALNLPDNEILANLLSQDEEKQTKKQKNSATKKKGEKTIDQIMKSLGNGTTEEKLHLLCRRHAETLDEYRLVEPRLKQLERQIISQQREKESTQAELNRMILAKSRLEGLCREMQRQSKAVKDESLLRIKEEEEKRKEVANKFQSTLNDISSLMQENSKKNIQLREENAELATKLKGLVDNYELWEQNMSKVVQQKELEAQLAKAKHAKVNLLLKQETEKFLREKQSLLENLSELQKRCTVLTSNELQLRTELSDYTSKYEEFQSVLSNSSKVFSTFKNDMETTSKKIKKLEKETNVYKQKWESSNKALLDMISHKEKQDKDFSTAQQRIICLEKLCRALQAERNELRNQINAYSSSKSAATSNPEVPSEATEAEVV